MTVLFVCDGNTCRSPMAAALFQKYAEERGLDATVQSAGIACAEANFSPYATAALLEVGIKLAGKARQADKTIVEGADAVVTMNEAQREALCARFVCKNIASIQTLAGEAVPDPYGKGLAAYRDVRIRLAAALPKIYEFVKKQG